MFRKKIGEYIADAKERPNQKDRKKEEWRIAIKSHIKKPEKLEKHVQWATQS